VGVAPFVRAQPVRKCIRADDTKWPWDQSDRWRRAVGVEESAAVRQSLCNGVRTGLGHLCLSDNGRCERAGLVDSVVTAGNKGKV